MSAKNDSTTRTWIDRLVDRAVAEIGALPEWKRDIIRAQVAALGSVQQ